MEDKQRKLRLNQEIKELKTTIIDTVEGSYSFQRLRTLTSSLKEAPYKIYLMQKDLAKELKKVKTELTKLEKAHGTAPKAKPKGKAAKK